MLCDICNKEFDRKTKKKTIYNYCSIKCMKSKQGFILEYGDEKGLKEFTKYRESKKQTLEKFIKKYGEELGTQKWSDYQNTMGFTLEKCITKYGQKLGTQKWNDYCNKIKYKNSKQRYLDEFGQELGTQKWNDYCNNRKRDVESYKEKCEISEKAYIKRYGEELGTQKWQETSLKKSKGIARNHYQKSQEGTIYILYVIENKIGIKVGITKDLDKRLKQISQDVGNVVVLFEANGKYEVIRRLENEAHNEFNDYNLTFNEKFNGFTEWFSVEIKDDLIQYIKEKINDY